MVHADAYRRVVAAADVEQGYEALFYALQFGGILCVGVFELSEGACRIDIVAGVDAHLLAVQRRHVGHLGVEVYVGDEGRGISGIAQGLGDVLHVLGLAHALCRQSYQFASRPDDAYCLFHACLGVVGVCGGHRLHAYGVVAADGNVPHLCL